jgi:hypothetical protein
MYVQYDSSNKIIGVFACEQAFPTTWVDDADPSVVAFLAPTIQTATTISDLQAQALQNPAPTQAETVSSITLAIQQSLDAGAKAWGYDNIVSAASYASSTNTQYAADAKALIGWRDAVWAWAIPQFATVAAGTDPTAFMATMPAQPAQPQ